jgi:hypothetical protein
MPPDPPALVPGPLLPPRCSVNAPCLSLSPRLGLPSCSLPVNAALLRQPQQSSSYSTSSSRRQQSIGVGVVTVILTAPASAAACISLHAGCCRSNSHPSASLPRAPRIYEVSASSGLVTSGGGVAWTWPWTIGTLHQHQHQHRHGSARPRSRSHPAPLDWRRADFSLAAACMHD